MEQRKKREREDLTKGETERGDLKKGEKTDSWARVVKFRTLNSDPHVILHKICLGISYQKDININNKNSNNLKYKEKTAASF